MIGARWLSSCRTVEDVASCIISLYEENEEKLYSDEGDTDDGARRGYEDLNLAIGFVDHATQAAFQASEAGADEETIIAALLHDIGWLQEKPTEDQSLLTTADNSVLLAKHDIIGGKMLRECGFSERLSKLVEGHVQAKRYLTFKEEGYYAGLSAGSKFTLSHQGGVMTKVEAENFENDADFDKYCQIRRWDEGAKVKDWDVPSIQSYKDMMIRCLWSALWKDRRGFSSNFFVSVNEISKLKEQGVVIIRNLTTIAENGALRKLVNRLPVKSIRNFTDVDDLCMYGIDTFVKEGRLAQVCGTLSGHNNQILLHERIGTLEGDHKIPHTYTSHCDKNRDNPLSKKTKAGEIIICFLAIEDFGDECAIKFPNCEDGEESEVVVLNAGDAVFFMDSSPHCFSGNSQDLTLISTAYGNRDELGLNARDLYKH
eukprot:m.18272 g.18272  ORF g.18272 m.18272 type:complete len:428 (+) comp4940_c0_seq1:99-1382(+)